MIWLIAFGIGCINIGFVIGVFWGARRRDDYELVERREMPRMQDRQQIFEYWEGLDR